MSWLLNIVYAASLMIISPWLVWRYLVQHKSRRGWSHKLFGGVPRRIGNGRCVWFHAVSVGEVNLLPRLIDRLFADQPGTDVVISTSTESGFDLAKSKYGDRLVFFCPLDFSWAVNRVLRRLRPDVLVLTELELWPNLILCAERFGTSVMIANARLSESSFIGYRRLRPIMGTVLSRICMVTAQNETYAERFKQLGCDPSRVSVTGNVKFDNAETNRDNPRTRELRRLLPDDKGFVFLAGSTQVEEELLAISVFKKLAITHPKLRLILVPRHPERSSKIARMIQQQGLTCQFRSQLTHPTQLTGQPPPILVVDVIGELGGWWGVADVGLVGGSFSTRGGQNMIEPAAFGIPVCFGPRTENFRVIVEQLLDANAAEVVHDEHELLRFVSRALADAKWSREIGQRAQTLVLQQQGATARTIAGLRGLLSENSENQSRAA